MSIQNKSFLSDTVNKFSFNEIPSWHKITIWGATLAPGTVSSPAWFHPSCNTIITDIHYNSESLKCFKTWKNFPQKTKSKQQAFIFFTWQSRGLILQTDMFSLFWSEWFEWDICTVDHTTGRTIGSSQGTPEDRQVPGCLALKSAPRYLSMMNDLIIVLDDLIKGSRQSDDVCLQLT